jgi:hypothetical protein
VIIFQLQTNHSKMLAGAHAVEEGELLIQCQNHATLPRPKMNQDGLDPPSLIVSIRDTGVAVVELNRPKKRNALSQALIDELTAALSQLDRSPTVRAIVLSGAEASPFCGMTIEITLKSFPRLTCVTQPAQT